MVLSWEILVGFLNIGERLIGVYFVVSIEFYRVYMYFCVINKGSEVVLEI